MARFFQSLFGGQKATTPPASALRIDTSLQGTPIAIVLGGQTRVAGNLIDYYGFNSQNQSASGGGKGSLFSGGGATETVYYATLIIGICEGPIAAIPTMWVGGTQYGPPGGAGFEYVTGTYPQAVWSYTEAAEPSHAQGYTGIVLGLAPNLYLGTSASLQNYTFEVLSTNNTALSGQPDGDATVALAQFLINGYWGVGFPGNRLGSLGSWQSYCLALGLVASPAVSSAVQASSLAGDITAATNAAACWQDGQLTVVPYGDTTVSVGSVTETTETHIVPNVAYPLVVVGNNGSFVSDQGVTYQAGGSLGAVSTYNAALAQGTYYQSGGNYYFSVADIGQTIEISYDWAATASYVAPSAPLYAFTIDDCLPNQGMTGTGSANTDSPFLVVRKSRDQAYNNIKLEYLDRNNQYNPVDIEVKDEASIVAFGRERPSDIRQYHFFCLASAAQQSATLQLLRQNILNTYQWTVGRHFLMILELMATATLTDPANGLNAQPVRIIEIQENVDFTITITAEDYPGTLNAPQYGTQANSGYIINANVTPDPVNTPIVFEPPAALLGPTPVGNTPEVWIAASGGSGGSADPNWGGCNVWLSLDASNYEQIGQIIGPARMGSLTAALPTYLGTNPDNVDTLSVNLAESNGALASISSLGSQLAANLCLVDDELISYTTATLVSGNTYNLTGLNRGLYGTVIQSHALAAPFARLDQAIFQYSLPAQYVNQTLYFKLPSFNGFGGGTQSLDTCTQYAYTPGALAYAHPLASALEVGSVDLGSVTGTTMAVDDFSGGLVLQSPTASPSFVVIALDLSVYFTLSTGSLLFKSAGPQYFNIAQKSTANTQIFTFATWFKYGGVSETADLFLASQGGGLGSVALQFVGGTSFAVSGAAAGSSYMSLTTGNVVSDQNWHHLCVAIDTTQATAGNRVKLYLDGTQQTLSGTSPPQFQQMALAAGVGQQMAASTGGTISVVNGFRIHTFTTSGTFTASGSDTVNYLLVGGGGGGGGYNGGGGGAGGLLSGTASVTATGYTITVGSGGAAGAGVGPSASSGASGVNSSFASFGTAHGGGGGGHGSGIYSVGGSAGGSGGGGGASASSSGGAGMSGQGYAGASGGVYGGGGGGSGAAATSGTGGAGAASSISGTSLTYAGGGGGGGGYTGGAGGGGNGSASTSAAGGAGAANSGGGGGGGYLGSGAGNTGGAGGSGIVVVAYPFYGNGINSFGYNFDGKLAQTYYIDGQALQPSDFASGSPYMPISFAGTYSGTADSFFAYNNGASTVTLGYDLSGENNNATLQNMTTANSSSDYP